MTAATSTNTASRFCSLCAKQVGLDGGGSAYSYSHVLAGEIPLPWPESMYSEPGVLPQELLDLRRELVEAYQRGEPLHIGALAIAPDATYSKPGFRRVISYQRPDGPIAAFTQEEYLVPDAKFGPLCWALLIDKDKISEYEEYRLPPSNVRDLMVCTHGAVDAACAKFGFPAYRQLRRMADQSNGQYRVWRVSHFGGHVFAPTLIDMPAFRYWGYIEDDKTEAVASQSGDVATLRACYRGWAGFESHILQIAERELFLHYGWPWTHYLKAGVILSQAETKEAHDEPDWAEVRIDYVTPDTNERGAYQMRVEMIKRIDCIYSTSSPETYAYPQYSVTHMERVA